MTTVDGELAATIGGNRKMVIFPLNQVPEMGRGRGVRLQRYKEKGLSDVTTFTAEDRSDLERYRRPQLHAADEGTQATGAAIALTRVASRPRGSRRTINSAACRAAMARPPRPIRKNSLLLNSAR